MNNNSTNGPGDKVPTPNRKEASRWVIDDWNEIDPDTIRKTYRHIGYETRKKREIELEEIVEGIDELII
jgi:hypothetical protein